MKPGEARLGRGLETQGGGCSEPAGGRWQVAGGIGGPQEAVPVPVCRDSRWGGSRGESCQGADLALHLSSLWLWLHPPPCSDSHVPEPPPSPAMCSGHRPFSRWARSQCPPLCPCPTRSERCTPSGSVLLCASLPPAAVPSTPRLITLSHDSWGDGSRSPAQLQKPVWRPVAASRGGTQGRLFKLLFLTRNLIALLCAVYASSRLNC